MKKILLGVMGLFLFYSNSHAENYTFQEEIQQRVTEIYVATFERAPAYSGLMYWTNAVETGIFTIEQVAQSFFDQPETQAKFPEGSSNTEFINTIYNNTLSRAPAEAGRAYWVDALDRGLVRRDQAIMAVINGAKAETGSAADAAMLAKKTEIGLLFANSEIGDLTTNENFMGWAKNIVMHATNGDFSVDDAVEYISDLSDFPSELETDIENYIALISSVGNMSPMIDEISILLEELLNGDSSVVTITPALETLDLQNLPSAINVTGDFGAGYTPEGSSSLYTGQLVMDITNIVLAETGLSANANIVATNVQRDEQLVLNGAMNLGISLETSGEEAVILATLTFSNLQSIDFLMNGGMELSMPFSDSSQPIILTLTNFETQGMQASGTIILTPVSTDIYDILLDLDTHEGAVLGTARLDATNTPQTIISTPDDPITVGEYSVMINDVIMDQEVCTDTAAGGNIAITGDSETKAITFNNCSYAIE